MKITILSKRELEIIDNALIDMGGVITDERTSGLSYHYYNSDGVLTRINGDALEKLNVERAELRAKLLGKTNVPTKSQKERLQLFVNRLKLHNALPTA